MKKKTTAEVPQKIPQDEGRVAILARIAEYEKRGKFDCDVEDDPPTRPLCPGEADYLGKKPFARLMTRIANRRGRKFFESCIRNGLFELCPPVGSEHLAEVPGAALVTCNHFNAFDNYAVLRAVEPSIPKKHELYKIIREGNYTSFPGLYGFFFRHCNTLPLGSRPSVLRELLSATDTLFARGEKILIYPEQGMWWNYKKPRPVKRGAYQFAVRANVPVLPLFITLEESDKICPDGFPMLRYTVHILPPIFPDPALSPRERAVRMAEENYRLWKETYESVYGVPLTYTTEGEVSPCSIS